MGQLDLLGRVRSDLPAVAYTPSSDTETSLEAAAAIVPRAHTDAARVLEALRARPDTDEGLGERLGMSGNSVRPRRRGLELEGLVEHDPGEDGEGRHALTRSGRRAKVWRAK